MAKPVLNPAQNLFKVNLLLEKGEQSKLHFKLLKWLLSSGRFIVVLVELVTIGAFVYRYKLDADLANLQEKIMEQKPYVESMQSTETEIRLTQFQLSNIKQIKKDTPNFAAVLVELSKVTPRNITLTNIAFDRSSSYPKTSLSITGQTPSNLELSAFIKALQNNPNFSDVDLSTISFEGQTVFTIKGNLAQTGGKT